MPKLELETAGRQFRRQFDAAIRSSLVRALTELITNSDDSYRRMENAGFTGTGRIEIQYDRFRRHMAVIDWAEGMDARDMEQMYPLYGAATSGLYKNQSVRGYFGKGMKDVLFSMDAGRVDSIKNGQAYSARFIWDNDRPAIIIPETATQVTKELRNRLGIPQGNGTRVSFSIPKEMRLPRHESLLRNLSNFYMLRLINSDRNRRVILRTRTARDRRVDHRVRYHFPHGEPVLAHSFELAQDREFPIHLELFRAPSALTQAGEDREGGLLVFDAHFAVLDLTLFGYDHDEYASHLFGTLEIENFSELLKGEEHVLTDTRDGLDRHHPFTLALAASVEERLRPVVERERHIQLQNTPRELSQKQRERLGNSVDQINTLLTHLAGLDLEFGGETEDLELPPAGAIEFRPGQLVLHPHCKSVARLRVDSSIIQPGTVIQIESDNHRIQVEPGEFELPLVPGELVITQNIIIAGNKTGEQAEITASTQGLTTGMKVRILEQDYPEPQDGLGFQPDVLRVVNNRRRGAALFVHRSFAGPGMVIHFSSDHPEVEPGAEEMMIEEEHYHGDIARIVVPIKGTGIGTKAFVTARIADQTAVLTVEVVSKTIKKTRSPVTLTGYRFDESTPSRVRANYDEETGLIWIYLKNPVVERYFGSLPLEVALNTPHCQILLAEIILEQIAWVARRKMLEAGSAMYLSNNHTEEDLEAVRRFMNEYGDKIHSWIADERVIRRVVEDVTQEWQPEK